MSTINVAEFVAKWAGSTRTERAAAQEHFIDLCRLLGEPTPNEADPHGEFYAFEKGTHKVAGGDGFADVWLKDHFAWEYKGKRKNLKDAYQQLLQYREDLDNPPLLVVCDLDRFEVHTNFTGTAKRIYAFSLSDLPDPSPTLACPMPALEVLRRLFKNPGSLRPEQTTAQVTERAAAEFAILAQRLTGRGESAEATAHFLMRLLFCLFAEDAGLLPEKLFKRLVERTRTRPADFGERLSLLFAAMATGGAFGVEDIPYFNGGLFTDSTVLGLTVEDMETLLRACALDWSSVEPAIFGTLFERSLDPSKRAQLGAHYTSRDDIELIVEPVLMAPLRQRWTEVQERARGLIAARDGATGAVRTRHQQALTRLLTGFAAEIASVRVLDPACGSGNFLYVSLKQLLDLEKEVITFAASNGLSAFFPQVGPHQLHGIEINDYAYELAQVVVWIGYLQWLHDNGFGVPATPILKPLRTITHMDALLSRDIEDRPIEPPWTETDVIVGNPPFLGTKKMRGQLGDAYVEELRSLYRGRVPGFADLCCYWFERAREHVAQGKANRVGLLATQAIRGGKNREVLDRIKRSGDIFLAWSDRPWILDGASVHVAVVGFDDGQEKSRTVDGQSAAVINADLTTGIDVTKASVLAENAGICFVGTVKVGKFDIDARIAASMRESNLNPDGRDNHDVVRPWVNGLDVTRRPRRMFAIDFGSDITEAEAALYEAPFEYVKKYVYPVRSRNRKAPYARKWWMFAEPCVGMREALADLTRYIATPEVAKHRLFAWLPAGTVPDHQLLVFARQDDYFFGVLHSRLHELWARRKGTQLREVESGFRYTPTTCFETFPFPWPPGTEPTLNTNDCIAAVASAAAELNRLREGWLNPPGVTAAELKRRTLTNLYNQRPAWLANAHAQLDAAVFDAYGWRADLSDEEILGRLLALNLEREAT